MPPSPTNGAALPDEQCCLESLTSGMRTRLQGGVFRECLFGDLPSRLSAACLANASFSKET